MALVTQVPSDPSIQFKKQQFCSGLVCDRFNHSQMIRGIQYYFKTHEKTFEKLDRKMKNSGKLKPNWLLLIKFGPW